MDESVNGNDSALSHAQWLALDDNERLLAGEELILEATESICKLLEEQELSRADLAELLGKSPAYVSQILNGSRNMTLNTLADISYCLGRRIRLEFTSLNENEESV